MLKLNTIYCLIAASVLAVVHYVSLELYLYWRYLWLDMPVHALGGAIVALAVFVPYDLGFKGPKRWLELKSVLLIVLMVALIWEVYELMIGIPIEDDYLFDTITDLLMGLGGGLIGYLVGKRLYEFKKF